jgi:hypothetical protein
VTQSTVLVDTIPEIEGLLKQSGIFILKRRDSAIDRFRRDGATFFRGENDIVQVDLGFTRRADGGIEISVARHFQDDIRILNERLVWGNLPPLYEAYRKNRQMDTQAFQRAYVLDGEGAAFWDGAEAGLYIYHEPAISSIEVRHATSSYTLSSSTFRKSPHGIEALMEGGINRYASSTPGKEVDVRGRFTQATDLLGARIFWYQVRDEPLAARSARLEVPQGVLSGWKSVASIDVDSKGGPITTLVASKPFKVSDVRVKMTPRISGKSLGIRALDFLVPGAGFELLINLDDHRDHRFYRFLSPERRTPDMEGMVMESRSATRRHRGDSARSSFTFHIGPPPAIRPRILHVPDGAQSLLIWTEHADRASIASHRAAYFGRSDIVTPDGSIGGFVRAGITTTKSVFYSNPGAVACSKIYPGPQSSLLDEPGFECFCRSLQALGYEICVHAPQPKNSAPENGPAAARRFAEQFGTRTWIDHSSRIVHCGLGAQSLDRKSPYWMAETWKNAGYRYFWQFGSEDGAEQRVGSINVQQVRLGDWAHTPLYWRHPTETGEFISWPTVRGGDLDVYTDAAIDELVADWGICINHTYPAAIYDVEGRSQYLDRHPDGGFQSSTEFENVLARFRRRIDDGNLTTMTLAKVAEYWTALEHIVLRRGAGNRISLVNDSGSPLPGLSVVVRATTISSGDASIRLASRDADKIVVIDLEPHESLDFDTPEGNGQAELVVTRGRP